MEIAIDATTVYVLLILFAATLIRSAIGFGEALFAVPLLALRIPLQQAAPLAVLLSIAIAAMVVAQDWKKIHFRSTGWLLPAHAGRDSAGALAVEEQPSAGVEGRAGCLPDGVCGLLA